MSRDNYRIFVFIPTNKIIFEKNLQDRDFASKMQKIINKSPEVIKTAWSAFLLLPFKNKNAKIFIINSF
jgi:hypothetical protein